MSCSRTVRDMESENQFLCIFCALKAGILIPTSGIANEALGQVLIGFGQA